MNEDICALRTRKEKVDVKFTSERGRYVATPRVYSDVNVSLQCDTKGVTLESSIIFMIKIQKHKTVCLHSQVVYYA